MRPFFLDFLADTLKSCENIIACWQTDIFSFWVIFGVKNGQSNLEKIIMIKNVFFPTGNDISQLFKVSAKKSKKKGLIVHTLI